MPTSRRAAMAAAILLGAIALIAGAPGSSSSAAESAQPGTVAGAEIVDDASVLVVEVYWGQGCRFCEQLFDFLAPLEAELDGFVISRHEVWSDPVGREQYERRAAELGFRADVVPVTIVDGSQVWIGFSGPIADQIERAIRAGVADQPVGPPAGPPIADPHPTDPAPIEVPFIGEVEVAGRSLVLATALIAVVDGFNPCSLWVLTVLLALVLHTGSRPRILAIGGAFLVVTTVVYGLFIIGVYSALSLIGALIWIRAAVAVFAFTFGAINVKDALWFKVGPSLTIPDERKPAIYRRTRSLIHAEIGLPAAMLGAAGLALGVALIEIPCTAGFPVIWSELVRGADVSAVSFAALLALYLAIYLLDELVVFAAAVITMRATRMQERHGQALKLVGGMVMISIAVTILFFPEAMDQPVGVLWVFGAALAASAVVAAVDRWIRPPGRSDRPQAGSDRERADATPRSSG